VASEGLRSTHCGYWWIGHNDFSSWHHGSSVEDEMVDQWPSDAKFQMGDYVAKKGRALWRGKIVGWYRTDVTKLGYAIESYFELGSVQIYPETAIEAWTPPPVVLGRE
jgi:dihydrofolate reductase (trimethoprim resistance protein)